MTKKQQWVWVLLFIFLVIALFGSWWGFRLWLPVAKDYVSETSQFIGTGPSVQWPIGVLQGRYLGVSDNDTGSWIKLLYRDKQGKPNIAQVFLGGNLTSQSVDLLGTKVGDEVLWPQSAAEMKDLLKWGDWVQFEFILQSGEVSDLLFEDFCQLEVRRRICQIVRSQPTSLCQLANHRAYRQPGTACTHFSYLSGSNE